MNDRVDAWAGDGAVPAVVLAGGRSRRMGGDDKALLTLDGRPIVAHVLDRLAGQAAPVAINANGAPDRFASYGLDLLADPMPGFVGPLAGVLAAMEWAEGMGADRVLSAACDTPFFPLDLVSALEHQAKSTGKGIAVAATCEPGGKVRWHSVFALWPVDRAADLRAAIEGGVRKVTDYARTEGAEPALFDVEDGAINPFFNINTRDDLARAEAWIESCR